MKPQPLGIDHIGHWTPAQYAIDAGWTLECVQATAMRGVSPEDAKGLSTEQQSDLLAWCCERMNELTRTNR